MNIRRMNAGEFNQPSVTTDPRDFPTRLVPGSTLTRNGQCPNEYSTLVRTVAQPVRGGTLTPSGPDPRYGTLTGH